MLNHELFDYVYDRLLLKPISEFALKSHSISFISCSNTNNIKTIRISTVTPVIIHNNSSHITGSYVLGLRKLAAKEICQQLSLIHYLITLDNTTSIGTTNSSIYLSSCSTTNYSIPLSLL